MNYYAMAYIGGWILVILIAVFFLGRCSAEVSCDYRIVHIDAGAKQ